MKSFRFAACAALVSLALIASTQIHAQQGDAEPASRAVNDSFLKTLPFSDRADFDDARRGFIATLPDGTVLGDGGKKVWDSRQYDFLKSDAVPATVNPSLWRQSQLNAVNGLFKVTDRVYQVRGIDLSNLTIIEGDTGLILIDPLLSNETAKAALDLYLNNVAQKPVIAVIYSHSHADHFGGAKGVISEDDAKSGKVKVIGPDKFMEHAVAENVIISNAMARRAHINSAARCRSARRDRSTRGSARRCRKARSRLSRRTISSSRVTRRAQSTVSRSNFIWCRDRKRKPRC